MLKKTVRLIHPVLFAIYPVLFLYAGNIGEVPFYDVLRPLIVLLVFAFLSSKLLTWLTRDRYTASLLVSFTLILFLSFGSIFELLIPSLFIEKHFLGIFYAFYILGISAILKWRRKAMEVSRFLNIASIILVSIPLCQLGLFQIQNLKFNKSSGSNYESNLISHRPAGEEGRQMLPDIYCIVFDSYMGASTLKDYWNYDNSGILNFLKGKGFYVAEDSRSNYTRTSYSMASPLNMDYLQKLIIFSNKGHMGKQSVKDLLTRLISQNQAASILSSKGYTYIDYSNRRPAFGWGHFKYLNDFEARLLYMTTFRKWMLPFYSLHSREDNLKIIENLKTIPNAQTPTFVYAHIMIPHDFLFNRYGQPAPANWLLQSQDIAKGRLPESEIKSRKERYLEQVLFVNGEIRELVDTLLSKSRIQPIIIIQGDHGFRELPFKDSNETQRFRSSILNAYYFPGINDSKLYPTISPVNTFRLIFNLYFGANYDLLEDKAYEDKEPYTLNWQIIR